MDMLLSTGERIRCALLAMAITAEGYDAVELHGIAGRHRHRHGPQQGAHPRDSRPRVREALTDGQIVLVAGFQGVTTEKDITTLGRGGSDTTAVALAARARRRRVRDLHGRRRRLHGQPEPGRRRPASSDSISYDEMLEMAASGAQVLALRSVEYARKYDIPIHVRSSFTDAEGTWVKEARRISSTMEQPIIRAVSYTTDEAKVTVCAASRQARASRRASSPRWPRPTSTST